jgi:putative selenate reductase molybdopterin-binding subunit
MAQALGFALTEEMRFDLQGHQLNPDFATYRIPRSEEVPAMDVIFVQTDEPSGPFGAKSVAEISLDGVAPAVASAVHDATGVWLGELPYTPEYVRRMLHLHVSE